MNDLFYVTDEQRMIRDLARKVARERIAPRAAHYDETESYPEDSIRALVEAGLYAIWVPEEYGGSDMGCLALALVCEEIAAACAAPTRARTRSSASSSPASCLVEPIGHGGPDMAPNPPGAR